MKVIELLGWVSLFSFLGFTRVPKLQLGNPDDEASASRDRKLELPALNSQAGAWELALTLVPARRVGTRKGGQK